MQKQMRKDAIADVRRAKEESPCDECGCKLYETCKCCAKVRCKERNAPVIFGVRIVTNGYKYEVSTFTYSEKSEETIISMRWLVDGALDPSPP